MTLRQVACFQRADSFELLNNYRSNDAENMLQKVGMRTTGIGLKPGRSYRCRSTGGRQPQPSEVPVPPGEVATAPASDRLETSAQAATPHQNRMIVELSSGQG